MIGCPWSDFQPGTFPLCEELVCSWIRQPMNAWSNLAYFGAALFLLMRKSDARAPSDVPIGLCALLIGICSFLGHASATRFFGHFDYGSIFLIFSYFLSIEFSRLGLIARSQRRRFVIAVFSSALVAMLLFRVLRIAIFVLFALSVIVLEIRLFPSLSAKAKKAALSTGGVFIAGVIALGLDASGTVCMPRNHFFQLHSIWHIASAASIALAARYLRIAGVAGTKKTL